MAADYVWGMYTGGVEKPAEIKMEYVRMRKSVVVSKKW